MTKYKVTSHNEVHMQQLHDVVITFSEVSQDNPVFAYTKIVRLDWEGTFREFVEYIAKHPKVAELERLSADTTQEIFDDGE